jgi:NADPH2:quinone reductase
MKTKIVYYEEPGDPSVLVLSEAVLPPCKEHEVLIRVVSSGINKPDTFQRKGHYPAPAGFPMPQVPGLEVAGTIEHCGSNVSRWKPGDEVCALLAGGGYAEYVIVDSRHCLPKPANLTFPEAASLPETTFTVWHNLFQRGRLKKGESVLIHGGSGGIGITALQLARLYASRVFTTAGTEEKCIRCQGLGADRAINYQTEDFGEVLKDAGVDVVLDSIGGSYFDKNIRLLNPDGRLVYINAVSGANVQLNIREMMTKRVTVSGSTLRSRDADFKAGLAAEVEKNVWPFIENKQFIPVIDTVFPVAEVVEAHRLMESGRHFGKIVINWLDSI